MHSSTVDKDEKVFFLFFQRLGWKRKRHRQPGYARTGDCSHIKPPEFSTKSSELSGFKFVCILRRMIVARRKIRLSSN